MQAYQGFRPFYGDLHSHSGLSYGYGSIDDAFRNARLQLDFASITAHAHWPDMPDGEGRLREVRRYHTEGFERAARNWPVFKEVTEANNTDGEFVTFLSFEWHSMRYGDHNVYYKDTNGEIINAPDLAALRSHLRALRAEGVEALLIPHHIGYQRGRRGIDWESFTDEFSPVVEIFSMHGAAASDETAYPYLHTMGPRDSRSTAAYGLAAGNIFGVIGSSDHHSAHPGSYGHGRLGVWARDLSRNGIWDAIKARRTYALTGDNIAVAFSVGGHPMGTVAPYVAERNIEVDVEAGNEIDYIEILENNKAIHRWGAHQAQSASTGERHKISLELGWGELDQPVDWHVDLKIKRGRLVNIEPKLRGFDIVSPQEAVPDDFVFSSWSQPDENAVSLATRSWRNPTVVSPATQSISLEVLGDDATRIVGMINDTPVDVRLQALKQGNHIRYLGNFLSPAFCLHTAVPESGYKVSTSTVRRIDHPNPTWYAVRVRQKNGQWAWSSPIWIGAR